jgi:arsenate reductase
VKSILFLCTGNSARSVMAEAMMNHLGRGRYAAYSAGSHPTGKVHPLAIETLRELGLDAHGLRSKSWGEFAAPGAPAIDHVVTVCDNAAGEVCPLWPGKPAKEHWGVDDPAAAPGGEAERRAAFREAARLLRQRIEAFLETAAA